MINNKYILPDYKKDGYNCSNCGAFSHQEWRDISYLNESGYRILLNNLDICFCSRCEDYSLWRDGKMIYPQVVSAPMAHQDMPDVVKELYNEARDVSNLSPRAAAALLRVALEKLTEFLGETEGQLNTRIGNLKKQGLPEKAIKGLDIVRITANEGGSHAGKIDLTGEDNGDIVNKLFWLVNFIIEKTITENNEIDEMFDNLPENKKGGIENRDKINN